MNNLKPKLIAFGFHLFISLTVISIFLIVATQFWYPATLFNLEKTSDALKILLPVDAILGPALTFLLYAPGKKNLRLDLSIIAIIQISALLYGAQVIYSQRPVLFVYNIKEFQLITASEHIREKIPAENALQEVNQSILIRYALPPQNETEVAYYFINSIAFQKDPSRMYPIKKYSEIIQKAAINITSIKDTQVEDIKKLKSIREKINSNDNIYLLPLRGSLGGYTYVAIDLNKSKIIDFINLNLPE